MADLVLDRELGTAYGFVGLEELGRYRIDQVENGVSIVRSAIDLSLAYSNQRNEAYRSILSTDVEVAKESYEMPYGGTLQDIDEHGNPLPVVQFAAQDVAYPIRGGGDATGSDRVSRALMTFEEANRATQQATLKDRRWHVNYMLSALLRSTSYDYFDRTRRTMVGAGRLTIKPLANGDTDVYITNQGSGTATNNHYLALVGAIAAANNPFPTIYDELVEHAVADQDVRVYVAKNLVSAIESLPDFSERRDARVTYGSGQSTVAEGDKGIGDRYIGLVNNCHIIRMNALADNYMFAHLDGQAPLGYRQYPSPTLRGLFQESHSPDGNHMETRFLRYGGYGVRNRVAALAMQVGVAAGGTYTVPTLPMALA